MHNANYLRETIDVVRQIETRFLELAARLFLIQKNKVWEGEYESFGEFIDATGLRRPLATTLTKIHQVYVVEGKIPSTELAKVGYQKLYDAIPLVEAQGAKKVVASAKLLTLGEVRDNVREEKYGECAHEEIIHICATCHKRVDD